MSNLTKTHSTRLMLRFEEGKASLSKHQIDTLQQWIGQWIKQGKATFFAVGGACKASRAGMLRRVRHLLHVLMCLGVTRKHIQQDNRWAEPTKMGAIDDLPPDTVWLELKSNKSS
jgi:hypothetical protein